MVASFRIGEARDTEKSNSGQLTGSVVTGNCLDLNPALRRLSSNFRFPNQFTRHRHLGQGERVTKEIRAQA